jgi:hypothetical protein
MFFGDRFEVGGFLFSESNCGNVLRRFQQRRGDTVSLLSVFDDLNQRRGKLLLANRPIPEKGKDVDALFLQVTVNARPEQWHVLTEKMI